MNEWFRVPVDTAKCLTGAYKVQRHEAIVDILGRWHIGADPGPRELMRAWVWSGERVVKLCREMHAWAKETGAAYPARLDQPTEQNRTGADQNRTAAGQVDVEPEPIVEAPPDSDRTKPDSGRTPHAGAFFCREREEREEKASPPAPAVVAPLKPPRAAKVPSGAYQLAIDAFDDEHKAAFEGAVYPWLFKGRDADGAKVKVWLAAARVNESDPHDGVARIRGAVRAYFAAVKARTAWPLGEPAQTRIFTSQIAKWLQTDPSARPTGPPQRAGPTNRNLDLTNACDLALERLRRANADP